MTSAGDALRRFYLAPELLVTVDEFPTFAAQRAKLGLTEDEIHLLELTILKNPGAGDVVPGAGGLRKIRFSVPGSGRGKSGAYRVYYLNLPEHGRLIFWAVFSKSDRSDISRADREVIGRQAQMIKEKLRKSKERGS